MASTGKSDSTAQQQAEAVLLDEFEKQAGLRLARKQRLQLAPKVTVEVDGVDEENCVLVEVYARIGELKGSQPRKVAMDALKLHALKSTVDQWNGARLVIIFASDAARGYFTEGRWTTAALGGLGIELVVIDLEKVAADAAKAVVEAQERQKMVNAEDPAVEPPDSEDELDL